MHLLWRVCFGLLSWYNYPLVSYAMAAPIQICPPVMCHMIMQDTKPTHLWIWAFVIAGFVGVYYIEEAVSSDKNSDNRV